MLILSLCTDIWVADETQIICLRGRPPKLERNRQIVADFRDGQTLENIGIKHGITRERARQIIAASGIDKSEGGSSVRYAESRAERAIKRFELDMNRLRRTMIRRCSGCKTEKPLDDFYKGQYRCKPCSLADIKHRYHSNPKNRERQAQWQRDNPEKTREYHRRWHEKKKRLAEGRQ